jgi:hypothetical protein
LGDFTDDDDDDLVAGEVSITERLSDTSASGGCLPRELRLAQPVVTSGLGRRR